MGAEIFDDDEVEEEDGEGEDEEDEGGEEEKPAEKAPAPAPSSSATAAALLAATADLPPELPPATVVKFERIRWEAHMSPSGVPFYFNRAKGESRWALPTGPLDIVVPPPEPGSASEKPADPDGKGGAAGSVASGKSVDPDGKAGAAGGSGQGGGAPEVDKSAGGASSSSSSSASSSSDSEDEQKKGGDGVAGRGLSRVEAFRELMQEKGIGVFDRFETWLPKLLGDPRFTAIPAMDRKRLFQFEAKQLGQRQRQNAAQTRLGACKGFAELLAAARQRGVLKAARTPGEALAIMAKTDLGKDPRWAAAQPRDRARLVQEVLKEDAAEKQEARAKAVKGFRALVQERILAPCEAAGEEPPPFGEARKRLREEERWKAVEDASERQSLYASASEEARSSWLRKRRRQAEDEDELAEKRRRNRRSEAEGTFRTLVMDNMKVLLDMEWAEARVALKLVAGARVAECDHLEEALREFVFNEVRRDETQRRLGLFSEALHRAGCGGAKRAAAAAARRGADADADGDDDEEEEEEAVGDEGGGAGSRAATLGPEHSFEEARAAAVARLPGGEAYLQGLAASDLRSAWEVWRRAQLIAAASDLEAFLKGSEHLFEAAADAQALEGRGAAFEALCRHLASDARYRRLEAVPSERKRILVEGLREAAVQRASGRRRAAGDSDRAGGDMDGEGG